MKRSALSILHADRAAAERFAQSMGKARARAALERAQRELNDRLQHAISGPGDASFTAQQLRSTLEQVRAVLGPLTASMKTDLVDLSGKAAASAAQGAASYVQAAEDEYGLGRVLPLDTAAMIDASVSGAHASLVRRIANDPHHPGKAGVLARYGLATMSKFEESLQQRLIQGKPWEAVKADLIADSAFLQQQPAHWAERLMRTEVMHASGAGQLQAINQTEAVIGPMLKVLCATFDDRTGADSYAVHGQIRRTNEPFHSWHGAYMHPPDRPNDRETVVPHNMSWPLPPGLQPRSDAEVAARWAAEGRKGSPPPRPLMSTVGEPGSAPPPPVQAPPPAPEPEPAPPAPEPVPVAAPIETPLAPARPFVLAPTPVIEPEQQALPQPAPPLNILDSKVSGAMGSNPGGVYRGNDGVERYVKFYGDKTQAAGEHLANKIYEALNLGALKSSIFEHEGKTAYASEMIPNAETLGSKGLTQKLARKALDGFAADVLLANWDAAGLSLDNLIVGPKGKVLRVDNGAALLSRAQGTRKPQSAIDHPTEWESFFNPGINPAYAKLASAAGVTNPKDFAAQALRGIEKIDKLSRRKGGWGAFVDTHAPGLDAVDRDRIVDMLTTRTAFLRGKIPELRERLSAEPPKSPPKPIEEAEIETTRRRYSRHVDEAAQYIASNPVGLNAMQVYTGSSYKRINHLLYAPEAAKQSLINDFGESAAIEMMAKHAKTTRELTDLLKQAKTDAQTIEGVVYRGVEEWPGLMQEIQAGEVVFKGFTSTSVNKGTSSGFGTDVLFRIRQKSGVPVDGVSVNKGEREVLLPPGVRFRVIAQSGKTEFGGKIIDLEEIE